MLAAKNLHINGFFNKLKNAFLSKNVRFTTPYFKEVADICFILQENFIIRGFFTDFFSKEIIIYLHYDNYGSSVVRDIKFGLNIFIPYNNLKKLGMDTLYIFATSKGLYSNSFLLLNHLNGRCIAIIKKITY